jgi:predicted amidohydrolase
MALRPSLRLALAQHLSPAGNIADAFTEVERTLRTASAAGAQMALMPELFLPGYNSDSIPALAQPRDGDWLARLTDLCRSHTCGVTIGYAEREGAQLFNAAASIGPDGAILAQYRKIQCFGPREARIFTPGDSYATFAFAGRQIGLLICYDVEFEAHVRALANMGVDLILVPTANMEPFRQVADHVIPAHAANLGTTIAYANYCGTEGDLIYCGGSVIAAPRGQILASAGQSPAILIVDLPETGSPLDIAPHLKDLRQLPH